MKPFKFTVAFEGQPDQVYEAPHFVLVTIDAAPSGEGFVTQVVSSSRDGSIVLNAVYALAHHMIGNEEDRSAQILGNALVKTIEVGVKRLAGVTMQSEAADEAE